MHGEGSCFTRTACKCNRSAYYFPFLKLLSAWCCTRCNRYCLALCILPGTASIRYSHSIFRYRNLNGIGKCLYTTILHTVLYSDCLDGSCTALSFCSGYCNRCRVLFRCSARHTAQNCRFASIGCIVNRCSHCRRSKCYRLIL